MSVGGPGNGTPWLGAGVPRCHAAASLVRPAPRVADRYDAAGAGAQLRTSLTAAAGWAKVSAMSIWESHAVLDAVVDALNEVHLNNPGGHHFGRPYLTAYQLAIKVDAAHPAIRSALDVPIGGAGVGERSSLAQYLGRELSRRIKQAEANNEHYPVAGAFISNEHLTELRYVTAAGQPLVSSLTGTGFDLSLFRFNPAPIGMP